MASYQLKNKIRNPEELKNFDSGGYIFNDNMSKEYQLVFTRK